MRTFKFRAWDLGKMYYQVRCGGEFDGISTAPTVWDETKGDWLNLTGQPHTIIMQYIGIKDATGKEIYEGDIIEDFLIKVRYLVSYDDLSAAFVFQPLDGSTSGALDWLELEDELASIGIDVIGNIYENPELLKEVK